MSMAPTRVVVACPTCRRQFEDWWRPMLNPDARISADILDQSLPTACPHCGSALDWDVMEERDGVFTRLTDDRGEMPPG